MNRQRASAIAALAVAVILAAKHVFLVPRPPIDFLVFQRASLDVLAGRTPYPTPATLWDAPFLYPHTIAYLLAPIAKLAFAPTLWFWLNLVFGCVGAAALWIAAMRNTSRLPSDRVAPFLFIVAAIIGFGPFQFAWRLGQIDILLLALVAVASSVSARLLPLSMGLAVSIATLLKVSPVIFVPALAVSLGLPFVVAFVAPLILYVAITASVGHLQREVQLFTDVLPTMKFASRFPENSLYRLLCSNLSAGSSSTHYSSWLTTALSALLLIAYAVLCGILKRRRSGAVSCLAVGIAFSHLLSPFLEPQHYAISLVPMILMGWSGWSAGNRVLLALLGGAYATGTIFIGLAEVTSTGWPAYLLLLSDLLIIAAVFLVDRDDAQESEHTNK